MMLRSLVLPTAIAAMTAVAGCGGGMEVGPGGIMQIPITSVTQFADGSELVLRGYIQPWMNFGSTFKMSDGGAIFCEGTTTPQGTGEMTCADAEGGTLVVMLDIPEDQYGKTTGGYASTGDIVGDEDARTGTAWGNQNGDDNARALLGG